MSSDLLGCKCVVVPVNAVLVRNIFIFVSVSQRGFVKFVGHLGDYKEVFHYVLAPLLPVYL